MVTKDNNKKKQDHQAARELKNQQVKENARHGKHTYSKDTDHL
ncbi:DUF3941 domain-containing protein [Halalkalibacterium halodurans]|jgi:hypothetical protein|uniref:BH2919 protein n=1 Tax=Halalkalibacterium halodurans (strain ATCC BAA-125 / DSM 18197 / FERM 7344 / JCM 9153 / C-125) TaxID=272558 RepID=Q9K8T3_HALH5|nr:DUF3941 domain-containing protein [Halalkalibacterium halodurans]MDY7223471.1 DUF3941 domain-containing protein [Halalkalibacterium halodurans]MDY7242692.1 DUF3941 domain-containing protein [Halalkalibacterium halodurans]MED3645334.1 DUF3941 domain-containing protein [Halalkalibacterium halodurans]MED4081601.1 DUF3941 domain-containing protein [Halalkalibacterium halodurans]MED4084987.1 DUF3941 domain-containing protein [Halalkalibacterium halodurans]